MRIKLLTFSILAMFCSMASYANSSIGKASFYANKFNGRKTSSGEIFYQDSLTCAHKTLPFGTLLLVVNPKNGKEVVVKVNDRGPFIKGRMLDLSLAAAKRLGIVKEGVAKVKIQTLRYPQFSSLYWESVSYAQPKLIEMERIEPNFEEYAKRLQGLLNGRNIQMDDVTSMKD